MNLEQRFDNEIAAQRFDLLEMIGFRSRPELAIKAGMAMGYKMGLNDMAAQLQTRPNVPVPPVPRLHPNCRRYEDGQYLP